jgi:hypothetical protein
VGVEGSEFVVRTAKLKYRSIGQVVGDLRDQYVTGSLSFSSKM